MREKTFKLYSVGELLISQIRICNLSKIWPEEKNFQLLKGGFFDSANLMSVRNACILMERKLISSYSIVRTPMQSSQLDDLGYVILAGQRLRKSSLSFLRVIFMVDHSTRVQHPCIEIIKTFCSSTGWMPLRRSRSDELIYIIWAR